MTCIVGIVQEGEVWMGADSAAGDTNSFLTIVREDPKVFKNGDFLFGFTSSFRMGQLLMFHKFKSRAQNDKRSDYEYMVTDWIDEIRSLFKNKGFLKKNNELETGGNFLLGYNGKLYEIDSDFQVGINACGYASVGCGVKFALGSLFTTATNKNTRERIIMALKAAACFSAYIKEPFIIIKS